MSDTILKPGRFYPDVRLAMFIEREETSRLLFLECVGNASAKKKLSEQSEKTMASMAFTNLSAKAEDVPLSGLSGVS